MSGLRSKRDRRRPELPLVPLIDVLVMLVLFSFVTMRFSTTQTRNIEAPKFSTAGKNDLSKSVTIGIEKDGVLTIEGRPVPDAELSAALKALKQVNNEIAVVILADRKSYWDKVALVMDACREVGIRNTNIQSR